MRDCHYVSTRAGVLYTRVDHKDIQISSDGELVSRNKTRCESECDLRILPKFLFVDKLVIGCV